MPQHTRRRREIKDSLQNFLWNKTVESEKLTKTKSEYHTTKANHNPAWTDTIINCTRKTFLACIHMQTKEHRVSNHQQQPHRITHQNRTEIMTRKKWNLPAVAAAATTWTKAMPQFHGLLSRINGLGWILNHLGLIHFVWPIYNFFGRLPIFTQKFVQINLLIGPW